ncbi:hypothetical protein CDAR_468541 [Caerostris darwini]|uniref:Uncharacterized protein n=1 Tax=Caerostris darwini TaxID=1538125 RepID=A0AAV4Q6D7_9ARAC|nr:hypothetical protein CDAR_468541 [Caerostris darwini]
MSSDAVFCTVGNFSNDAHSDFLNSLEIRGTTRAPRELFDTGSFLMSGTPSPYPEDIPSRVPRCLVFSVRVSCAGQQHSYKILFLLETNNRLGQQWSSIFGAPPPLTFPDNSFNKGVGVASPQSTKNHKKSRFRILRILTKSIHRGSIVRRLYHLSCDTFWSVEKDGSSVKLSQRLYDQMFSFSSGSRTRWKSQRNPTDNFYFLPLRDVKEMEEG